MSRFLFLPLLITCINFLRTLISPDYKQSGLVSRHLVAVPSTPNKAIRISNSISGIRRYKYWPTICTPRILLFRSEIQSTDTQIKYKPPIVTTRLDRLSYFVVYIFQSLFTYFNICTQIFTLSRQHKICVFLLHLLIPAILSLGLPNLYLVIG